MFAIHNTREHIMYRVNCGEGVARCVHIIVVVELVHVVFVVLTMSPFVLTISGYRTCFDLLRNKRGF